MDPEIVVGEIAHIVSDSDIGPRADATMPSEARRGYPNLILLCPNHHVIVDGQASTHTAEDLREWKAAHEKWVQERLADEAAEISFAELELVTSALLVSPVRPEADLTLTDPSEKMSRNGLTASTRHLLQIGQLRFQDVQDYVSDTARIDSTFPDRLRSGFINEYHHLLDEGFVGDELFAALSKFASAQSADLRRQAAGLAVVTYLFHLCDVFTP